MKKLPLLVKICMAGLMMLAHPSGTVAAQQATAIFAGGCFWCMEPPYEKLTGVVSVVAGYTGGAKANPTYDEVSAGGTGHLEAVRVVYDPAKISYSQLLDVFWRNIDPTDGKGQFCDVGDQYRAAVFYLDQSQQKAAEASKRAVERSKTFKEPVVTEIRPATPFYPAEEYHQDYYKKNPLRYKFYRSRCGRDQRLQQLWGKAGGK